MSRPLDVASLRSLTDLLSCAGFIAAEEEAAELVAAAGGDGVLLDALVARRLSGEPLAWITQRVSFCGLDVHVDSGVYVPRWHSEALARRAASRLPSDGSVAVDLCTGSGAVAMVLATQCPGARVVATDVDDHAVACARRNGVEAWCGDLFAPVPAPLRSAVDVVVAVVPYVPTAELPLLQRDTFSFETPLAYDGGADGCDILRRVLADSVRWLRPGGAVLLEVGGHQDQALAGDLARLGYGDVRLLVDDDGDLRGLEATLLSPARPR